MAPGTEVAGLVIEPSGTVVWQWVTFFIFGNLFGGFWLLLAALNAFPQVAFQFHQILVKFGLAKPNTKQGRHAHAPRPKQEEQQQDDQQQDGTLDNAPAGSVRPAASVPKPAHLQHLGSLAHGGPTTPLRSHRSRPVQPPEICMEQTITPRTSLPLSPRGSLTPVGPTGTPLGGAGAASLHMPQTPQDVHSGTLSEVQQQEGVVLEDDEETINTETSSLDTEPVLVKLEWRNLCYAVKSASGLRLIVQVRGGGRGAPGV